MLILSSAQIRAWDEFTIAHEPIASIDLMERAAAACVQWLMEHDYAARPFCIFCGKGNNGGDGLAIARMLLSQGCRVSVYILEFGHKGTEDFQQNLARLHSLQADIRFIQSAANFPQPQAGEVVIDALLGSGLNRPLEGVTADLVKHINESGNEIIAIDIPSGLFVDKSSKGNPIISATHTLSFQCYKPALLVAENEAWFGEVHILNIGLHKDFQAKPEYYWIDVTRIKQIYKPRKKFSHKGSFGHALLVAGSMGKMGAAVMAAKACLRSGAGLLTMHVPGCGLQILQSTVPEAMCEADRQDAFITHLNVDINHYDAAGIGPGLGREELTAQMLESILRQSRKPVVLDADALNIISTRPYLLELVPPHSILTPHPKEFERLFGKSQNDFERISLAKQQAQRHQLVIVLKGQHTFIACANGNHYFNSTGNPGMATGGSGDVLTGIVTGLLAQGYEPEQAAVFGVFWHGLAGDIASEIFSEESMIASDIPGTLGHALRKFTNPH